MFTLLWLKKSIQIPEMFKVIFKSRYNGNIWISKYFESRCKRLKKTEFMIIFVERNLLLLKVKYEQTLYKLTPL